VDPHTQPPSSHPQLPDSGAEIRRRLDAIENELSTLFYKLVAARQAATGGGGASSPARLQLSLQLKPPGEGNGEGGSLCLQLQRAAERLADRGSAFPLGHVYCHWCRSFSCAHSSPPQPRSVFGGYTATGQPLWPELASVLLERRDPRIEQLFRGTPSPAALVQAGDELASDQLSTYGKGSSIYRVVGQVVLGYLTPPAGSPRLPYAVTFQAVEAAQDGAMLLNVLGKLADGIPAYEALEAASDPRLTDALLSARRALADVVLSKVARRQRRRERSRRVLEILQRLARNLDRIYRQSQRRTRHSQDRHRNRQRPASTALRDALQATREAIYRDVEKQTWVVLGPKNRVHVFNDDGLHITSVVYPGETVQYRTQRGKWLTPRAEQTLAFQQALRRRASDE
jgi:hypothetical protein